MRQTGPHVIKWKLEKTEVAIKNGHCRDTGKIGHRKKTNKKQKTNKANKNNKTKTTKQKTTKQKTTKH